MDQLYWMDLSGLSDAHVSVVHSGADSADYDFSSPDTVERGTQVAGDNFTRSVYSVVEADEQFPECTHLREALIVIEYCKGEDNDGRDALSRWAYPAGLAQDVSFHGSAQDLESWNECELQENVRSQQFLREQYPDTFGEYKTVRGCQVEGCTECVPVYFSSPEEARDLLLRAHAESELYNIAEGSPAHCPAFADEDGCLLFLRDCTYPHPAGRCVKKDFQIHCGSDLSAVEVLPLEPVPLQPDTSVLNSDWEEHYSSDPVFGPILDELDSRGVSGQFRLHAGRVRFQGRICVPLRILDDVISGVHTYAHPGVYKTHQLFNRRYIVHEVSGDAVRKLQYHALYKRIQSVVSHCQVCQAVKGRKGVQPDTMTHYPIPENPLSSVAMDFCHLPTVTRSKVEYDSVLVVVCRLTGYVRAILCN